MATVKGSRQYQMRVVPHRPFYRVGVFLLFVMALGALCYLSFEYGQQQGLALKVEVVRERDAVKRQLEDSTRVINEMRQEIASLKLGEEVDTRATEEVRQTVEELQSEIADLSEEILFYKGVMIPNVENQGLRIERLNIEDGLQPNQIRYSLLLTQVVEKHDYVQGAVEITVLGTVGGGQQELKLSEVSENDNSVRFRFRYFQNINGEMTLPDGFEPREVTVVAQSGGRNGQKLERIFQWAPSQG